MKKSILKKLIRKHINEQKGTGYKPPSDKYPFGQVSVDSGPNTCGEYQYWTGTVCQDFQILTIPVCVANNNSSYMCIPGNSPFGNIGLTQFCNQPCGPSEWWQISSNSQPCSNIDGGLLSDGYNCCASQPLPFVFDFNETSFQAGMEPAPQQLMQFFGGEPPVIIAFDTSPGNCTGANWGMPQEPSKGNQMRRKTVKETRSLLNEVEDCGCGHRIMCDDSDQAQFYCSSTCCGETIYCEDGSGPYTHDPSEDHHCRPEEFVDDFDFDQSFYDTWQGDYGHHPGHGINWNKDIPSSTLQSIEQLRKEHCPSMIGKPPCPNKMFEQKGNFDKKPIFPVIGKDPWWAFHHLGYVYYLCCWDDMPDPPTE